MNSAKTNSKSTIVSLVLLTLVGAIGCVCFGYICLPIAAGMYAALLFLEADGKRIFSYVIPGVMFVANLLLNGFYSLEAVAYVIVGALLYWLYKKGRSKAESAFWLTSSILLLMLFSACIIAFRAEGEISFAAISRFYGDFYREVKAGVLDRMTSLTAKNEVGITTYLYSVADAEILFISAAKTLLPIVMILSFLLAGFTLKLFSSQVKRYSVKEKIFSWKFTPSSFVAYFYLIVSIISLVATDGILAESIFLIEMLFSVVFAYMGIKMFRHISSLGKGGSFLMMIVIMAILLFGQFAYKLLSYLGVYYTVGTNRMPNDDTSL